MAVPKRKTSKARRDKRRASNIKMTAPNVATCPQCHEPTVPHRVCGNCGYYNGKETSLTEEV
jgi:large subunit ribosomal protein L32